MAKKINLIHNFNDLVPMTIVGDRKRAAEFLSVAEKLKLMLQTIENGKKIDILKIDPEVTPAVILGYSEEER